MASWGRFFVCQGGRGQFCRVPDGGAVCGLFCGFPGGAAGVIMRVIGRRSGVHGRGCRL